MSRSRPNILVTGTPGTGKTTLCEQVAALTGFVHVNVTELAKRKNLVEEYDEEMDTFVIDEDKVCGDLFAWFSCITRQWL
jgi:adenylate kinase